MKKQSVVIIDYGMGNVGSVKNALDFLHVESATSKDKGVIKKASHLILPGVGAFAEGMRRLRERGLVETLKEEVLGNKKLFLGVCLGMQLLAEVGEEDEINEGLGFIKGRAVKLDTKSSKLPLPHIGWNDLIMVRDNPLFKDVSPLIFYFVHSYYLKPKTESVITAYCDYGIKFAASVWKNNIFGAQFHPERSQMSGIKVYENFLNIS